MNKTKQAIMKAYEAGYRATENGDIISPKGILRKTRVKLMDGTPYKLFTVGLDGKSFPLAVHRFCAYQKYGIAIFNEGIVVRHLNNNSSDNSLKNLGIGTAHDNMMDKPKDQRIWQAIRAGVCNNRKDWDEIDKARESGMSYKQLRKIYGVPLSSLSYRYGKGKRNRLNVEEVERLNELFFTNGY